MPVHRMQCVTTHRAGLVFSQNVTNATDIVETASHCSRDVFRVTVVLGPFFSKSD